MALLDDMLPGGFSGGLIAAVTVGTATILLPRLLPRTAPALRDAALAGIKLFVEAGFEAEGGLIDQLVGQTVEALIESAAKTRDPAARRHAAGAAVHRFERRARARAAHWGRDHADSARRYRRHVRHLQRALEKAERERPELRAEVLQPASQAVSEDW